MFEQTFKKIDDVLGKEADCTGVAGGGARAAHGRARPRPRWDMRARKAPPLAANWRGESNNPSKTK
jgi:hypothetical protein